MKTFSMLPADVQRALARRELRRRGIYPHVQAVDAQAWLRFASDADLERMETLTALYAGKSVDDLPADVRAEWGQLIGRTCAEIRCAHPDAIKAGATDDEVLALAAGLQFEHSAANAAA